MLRVDEPGLPALRASAAAQLAERARDTAAPLGELRDLHERLRLMDAALAATARVAPPRRWSSLIWPAVLVGAGVSVAAAVPVPRVPFTLELQARSVRLQLDTAGELATQPVDAELRIEGQTRLESPAGTLRSLLDAGAEPLVLRAARLSLRRLGYPAGSLLVVSGGAPVQLSLQASRPVVAAEFEFAGATGWRAGSESSDPGLAFAHAEWLRASAGDAATPERRPPPLDLWLGRSATRSFVWSGLQPVALQFVERRGGADARAPVASSLEQARITLPATNAEVRLGAGDRLEIEGLELERFELTAGDSVGIKLSGSARVLATRTGDFERSLKPSLLEFVARHHTIGLFWSAALMLWGVVAWLRKQFGSAAA